MWCRYSVLFNNKDHVAVLIADVEATQVLAEVVDVVHLADQGRCRERLLARHRQTLLLLLCQISLPKVQAQLSSPTYLSPNKQGFLHFPNSCEPARAAALSHNLTHTVFGSGIHKFCQHSVDS